MKSLCVSAAQANRDIARRASVFENGLHFDVCRHASTRIAHSNRICRRSARGFRVEAQARWKRRPFYPEGNRRAGLRKTDASAKRLPPCPECSGEGCAASLAACIRICPSKAPRAKSPSSPVDNSPATSHSPQTPMTRRTLEITALCIALLIAALATHAWLSSRDEQQRFQATLTTEKKILDAANTRERTRDATLNDALAKIEKLKRATQTPQQILSDLPNYLPLPQPIALARPAADTHPQQGTALPAKSDAAALPSPSEPGYPAHSAEPRISPTSTRTLPPPAQPAIPCNPGENCGLEMPSA